MPFPVHSQSRLRNALIECENETQQQLQVRKEIEKERMREELGESEKRAMHFALFGF